MKRTISKCKSHNNTKLTTIIAMIIRVGPGLSMFSSTVRITTITAKHIISVSMFWNIYICVCMYIYIYIYV